MTTERLVPSARGVSEVSSAPRERLGPRSDLLALITLSAWVPAVLLLDRDAGIWFQRLLGAATWLLLFVLLRRENPLVRTQVAVVIVFATAIEYIFSPLLEVYIYRLDNVPSFVPPGHGLVYLGALIFGRQRFMVRNQGRFVAATVMLLGAYAGWGLFLNDRRDVLGAFWFLCLVGFLRWGRSVGLYVGAAVVVTYLEILGTWIGNWEWQTSDPTGLVSIGNPPSGAAGGYGWFDLAAVITAPAVLEAVRRVSRSRNRQTLIT